MAMAPPHEQRRHHAVPEPGGVEEWQRAVRRLAPPVEEVERVQRAGQRQGVRDHRALGGARGARGVHDRLEVAEADVDAGRLHAVGQQAGQRRGGLAERAEPDVGRAFRPYDEAAQIGQVPGHLRESVGVRRVDDQRRGVGGVQDVPEQFAAVADVDRHGDGPQPGQREDHVDEVGAVGEHHADVVAPVDARGGQPLGHAVGHRVDLAVGDLALAEFEEGLCPMGFGPLSEYVTEDEARQRFVPHSNLLLRFWAALIRLRRSN